MNLKKFSFKPLYKLLQTMLGVKRHVAQMHAYRGFGSNGTITVLGRVTQYAPEVRQVKKQKTFSYALSMLRSYASDPIEGVAVVVDCQSHNAVGVTDSAGMFEISVGGIVAPDTAWINCNVSLDGDSAEPQVVEVLLSGPNNTYGIISDIDDTVLVSNATQKIKLIFATLFKLPRKRQAFPGVTKLYSALVAGPRGNNTNPIFYVSSSHWNLFSFLTTFFYQQDIPKGPLMLKDTTGVSSIVSDVGDHTHKARSIIKILEALPSLNFILLGDSGQHDAEIYTDIALEYPDRILMIYIRNISLAADPSFDTVIQRHPSQDHMVLVQTSAEIAQHALGQGYITAAAAREIMMVAD